MKNFLTLPLVFVLGVLLSGCGSPQINVLVDGQPMPNTSLVARSDSTQMRIESYVYYYSKKKEAEEIFPSYLEIGKKYVLPHNINYVGGKVRVINPLKVKYYVAVTYTVKYGEDFPYKTSHVIYEGVSIDKIFNIGRKTEPDKRPDVLATVVIGREDKSEIFNIDLVEYQLKQ